MNILEDKKLLVGIGVAVVIGLILFLRPSGPAGAPGLTDVSDSGDGTSAPAAKPGGSSPAPTPSGKPSPGPAPVPVPSGIRTGIAMLTPAAGDVFVIGEVHAVSWTKESGVKGGVQLLKAGSKELVGWILPTMSERQTSFTWNGEEVAIDRVGSNKRSVMPGSYVVRLVYDKSFAPVDGPVFSYASSGGEVITHLVRLQNVSVTPRQTEAKRGQKVIFMNGDAKPQTLSGSGFPTIVLPASGYNTLDTNQLAAGTYNFASNVYTYQAPGTLIVR